MRSSRNEDSPWVIALQNMKERLNEPLYWYPIPAIISFALVLTLGGNLLTDLNPRLGSSIEVLPFEAPRNRDGGIWLGIYQENQRTIVITSERNVFSWPLGQASMKDLDPLVRYLNSRVEKEVYSTALTMEPNLTQVTAVLAVDQHLKYSHIRPVIYALASASISRYGFETRIIH